jgi:hypothetical protein
MNIRRFLTTVIMLTVSAIASVSAQNGPAADMDSVEISLLTCSPHEEIYSLYGHTALRYHDLRTGDDIALNWGVFDFNKSYFVLRFVFGLTDYELGPTPFEWFCDYYKHWGSSVMEQVLNLTPTEKRKVQQALAENLKPENKVYRYNYFYDNCSTRPRDIIERCLDGRLEYAPREDFAPSYRQMVHECTRNHEWAKFGNDMLLGLRSDLPTTREQQEFLPANLMYDFDHAQIYADGEYRPLVKERRMPVAPGVQVIEPDFPVSPMTVFLTLLFVSLVIFAIEWKRHLTYKYWDAALMLIQGLAGCVLFVMIFSQHPTTSLNLQLLLLNPLPLFFIPAILKRKKNTYWWLILAITSCLFYIGAKWQDYAEGMIVLALCLQIRCVSHYKNA